MRQDTALLAPDGRARDVHGAPPSPLSFGLHHVAGGLLNALLRETAIGTREGATLRLALGGGSRLEIPVVHDSPAGRHGFAAEWRLVTAQATPQPISLPNGLACLLREGAFGDLATPEHREKLLTRALDAGAAIDAFLDARGQELAGALTRSPEFLAAEQGLLLGHPVHPAPKPRDAFQGEDRTYAPELGGSFSLIWLAVAPEALVIGEAAPGFGARAMAAMAQANGVPAEPGRVLLPMHPWQWARLQKTPEVAAQIDRGAIRVLNAKGAPWWPTASVRSLWAPHAPFMLKVSLSIQVTNSLRVLRQDEVDRGIQVQRILDSPIGEALRAQSPQFRFLGEPVYAMLRAAEGQGLPDSLVVLRENPIDRPDAPVAMLAALCQDHPTGGNAWIVELIGRVSRTRGLPWAEAAGLWFDRFLEVAIAPVLLAASDFGLLFGAHQQNLLIGLADDLPATAMFRDCQGTAYVVEFETAIAEHIPDIGTSGCSGFSSETAAKLISYYIFLNAVFLTIAAIARGGQITEAALFARWRGFLERLAAGPRRDHRLFALGLAAPELTTKGNFLIALSGLDEAGAAIDPITLYHDFPNPLVA